MGYKKDCDCQYQWPLMRLQGIEIKCSYGQGVLNLINRKNFPDCVGCNSKDCPLNKEVK